MPNKLYFLNKFLTEKESYFAFLSYFRHSTTHFKCDLGIGKDRKCVQRRKDVDFYNSFKTCFIKYDGKIFSTKIFYQKKSFFTHKNRTNGSEIIRTQRRSISFLNMLYERKV